MYVRTPSFSPKAFSLHPLRNKKPFLAQAKKKMVEVIVVGLFNTISNWKAEREEKHRAVMEVLGKCPECNGRGFPMTYSAVYPAMGSIYSTSFDCHGCNGSGLYADWVETNQEQF